nr:carbonyl reductase [nadph] 1 [Quercus suber]
MPLPIVVVVTGANRGIGQAICHNILAKQHQSKIQLIATSRKGEDLGLSSEVGHEVAYSKLDITESGSVRQFADHVQTQYGRADVLINNAGVNLDAEYSYENAKRTLDVNYGGTRDMCLALLPLLNQSTSGSNKSRIVNVSSVASALKSYSHAIQSRFRNPAITLSDVSDLRDLYLTSVKEHSEGARGWFGPGRSYSVSKALINAMTVSIARENPEILVNACCPGWIDTDMGGLVGSRRNRPPKTPGDGAKIPVRLAFDDLEGASGKYWANESVRSKEEGGMQEW